jgi:hypothetical protein
MLNNKGDKLQLYLTPFLVIVALCILFTILMQVHKIWYVCSSEMLGSLQATMHYN